MNIKNLAQKYELRYISITWGIYYHGNDCASVTFQTLDLKGGFHTIEVSDLGTLDKAFEKYFKKELK